MSGYKLEGHKLHLHPDRVCDWYMGGDVFPIYVEVGPTSICNHRCKMCAYDYLDHQTNSVDANRLIVLMEELHQSGVRSVCFAGDGEPLLNKGTISAIIRAKELGVDVSLSTNGVLCNEDVLYKILPALTWMRFSVNGGNAKDYSLVHGAPGEDFEKVMNVLELSSRIKKALNLNVTLGVQFVFLPENASSVLEAAERVKKLDVDYFVVKPFYQNDSNVYNVDDFSMESFVALLHKVEGLSDANFQSSVRWDTEKSNITQRRYDKCYGLSFITIISASGDVYPCLPNQEDDKSFGNINDASFKSIWLGEQREWAMKKMDDLNKNHCQPNCRHHWINEYLWDIKNPHVHKNFI